MRNLAFILFFSFNSFSQTAFQNFGNVQLHNDAKIGFHTDVVNEGLLDNYIGFAGFYADNEVRIISGSNRITFFDVEIDALNDLELQNSLGVRNQLDFINGLVITPRNNPHISLDFLGYDMYAGEDDLRHVDGYSSTKEGNRNDSFTFPIGDGSMIRPMMIPNHKKYYLFKGAYFFEDPNFTSTFTSDFLTDQKQILLENISNIEFWDLDGEYETRATLTWNNRSDISAISNEIPLLTVVGWSISENRWVNLNVTNVTGNLDNGEITSAVFIPNNYEVITIGSIINDKIDDNNSDNIIISPNGDDLNEFLYFKEVDEYTNNKLTIYNRWGNIVYQTDNYFNDWNGGVSNGRATIERQDKLPEATYFYYLESGNDPNKLVKLQKGWVYIHR